MNFTDHQYGLFSATTGSFVLAAEMNARTVLGEGSAQEDVEVLALTMLIHAAARATARALGPAANLNRIRDAADTAARQLVESIPDYLALLAQAADVGVGKGTLQ